MPDTTRKRLFGLVDAGGAGAGSSGQSNEWRLSFTLAAWREPGGNVVTQERLCLLPMPKSETQAWMQRVQAYDVVEVEIDPDAPGPATLLRGILRTGVQDAQLRQIAAGLQKQIVLSDPDFGELVYEREYNWYTGTALWNGKTVNVTLSCSDPQQAQAVLQAGARLFQNQADWQKRINEIVVAQLLKVKNDTMLEDHEEAYSAEQFLAKIALESISVQESGYFTFWHDDGDLFCGHVIQVDGDLAGGLTDAAISG